MKPSPLTSARKSSHPTSEARRIESRPLQNNRLRIGFRESGIVVFTMLVVIAFSLISPQFLTVESFRSIINNSAITIVVAAGMTSVIVSRQIDLSVGAILAISAYATAFLLAQHLTALTALVVAISFGAGLGLINGGVITALRVPAIIATLGTASVYRGVLYLVAARLLGYEIHASQLPSSFRNLSTVSVLGIPLIVWIALGVAIVVGTLLAFTPWGRNLYAMGSNPEGAHYSGIQSSTMIVAAFTLLGAASGLGGFLYVMRYATTNVRTGTGFEFSVIAAVVLGGVAIFGGSGRVFGVILGALLLNILSRGFVLMYIPEFWKDVSTGVAIVGAVLVDRLLSLRREDRLRKARRPHLSFEKERYTDG
jgi:rhamnose transport system permease protein